MKNSSVLCSPLRLGCKILVVLQRRLLLRCEMGRRARMVLGTAEVERKRRDEFALQGPLSWRPSGRCLEILMLQVAQALMMRDISGH